MARVKLYKVVVDSPIGFATINQLADNAAELRTQLAVEHGTLEPGARGGFGRREIDYTALGRHNLTEIPRSVAHAISFTSSPAGGTSAMLQWVTAGIAGIWRVGTGDYMLPVIGLPYFWGKASVVSDLSATYLEPQVRPFFPSASNGYNSGLRVSIYALSGGAFSAADASFSLALYGTP